MGPQERIMHQVYERFDGDGLMAMVLRLKGVVEKDPLEQALMLLSRRHPKLRARIVTNAEGVPCFEVLEKMPLTPVKVTDVRAEDPPWAQEGLRMIATKPDSQKGPLWRVEILRSIEKSLSDVFLVSHHAILDGVTSFRFYHDMLSFYEILINGEEIPADRLKPLSVIMSSELPVTTSLFTRTLITIQMCARQILKKRGAWTSLPGSEESPFWCRMVLSKDKTNTLRQRCRVEQTTVGAALFAAAVSSLAKSIGTPESLFRCGFAIDLREMSPQPIGSEHMGCFVSLFENVYRIKPSDSFWDVARCARGAISRFLDRQGPALTTHLMKLIKVATHFAPPKRGTLGFSNFGVAALNKRYGSLIPSEFGFIGRNRQVGPSLNMQAVTVNGRLNMTHGATGISEGFRKEYHRTFRSLLKEAIEKEA